MSNSTTAAPMASVSKGGQTWTFTLDTSADGNSLYLYDSASTVTNNYVLRIDPDGSVVPLAGGTIGSSTVPFICSNLIVTGSANISGILTDSSGVFNGNVTIGTAGTGSNYGSVGSFTLQSWAATGGLQDWTIYSDQNQILNIGYNGVPTFQANASGTLFVKNLTGTSPYLNLWSGGITGGIEFYNYTGSTVNITFPNAGGIQLNNGSITAGSSSYGPTSANINGSLSAQNTTLTSLNTSSANISSLVSHGLIVTGGNVIVQTSNIATSGASYPSPYYQLSNSIWTGSPTTNTWQWYEDASNNLNFQYNGVGQFYLTNSGNIVATGSVTALEFYGSGAGLTTGSIPLTALVSTPIAGLTAGSNIIVGTGSSPSVALVASPVFANSINFGTGQLSSLSLASTGAFTLSGPSSGSFTSLTLSGSGSFYTGSSIYGATGAKINGLLTATSGSFSNSVFASASGSGFINGLGFNSTPVLVTDGTNTFLRPYTSGGNFSIYNGAGTTSLFNITNTTATFSGVVAGSSYSLGGGSVVLFTDGTNTEVKAYASGGNFYINNYANSANNAHFPDAGGLSIDRGNITIVSGNINPSAGLVLPISSASSPGTNQGTIGIDSSGRQAFQVQNSNGFIWYYNPSGTASTLATLNSSGTLNLTGSLTTGSSTYGATSATVNGSLSTTNFGIDATTAQITMNNATSNMLVWNTAGVALPAFTTRSAGTKILLYPDISSSTTDFAIGIASSTLWDSVPSSSCQFQWYAGTTAVATLSGTGNYTIIGATATKASGTTWANPSDVRIKKNIIDYEKGIEGILALRPRQFEYNGLYGSKDDGTKHIGYIAQEVEQYHPEMIIKKELEDLKDFRTLDTSNITPMLVNSIKELNERIKAIEERFCI